MSSCAPAPTRCSQLGEVEVKAHGNIVSHGVRLGVRANNASLLYRLCEYVDIPLEPLPLGNCDAVYSIDCSDAESTYSLYVDSRLVAKTNSWEYLAEVFESELHLRIAEYTSDHVFIHAGVVSWGGRAIVLPGPSHCGKSTLIKALIERGASYLSDEYAPIDASGRVSPFPRAIRLRFKDGRRRIQVSPASIGSGAIPVGLILVTRYRTGGTWRPKQLSRGQAALQLLRNAVCVRRRPADALATATCVAASSIAFRTARGEAGETVEQILDLLNS